MSTYIVCYDLHKQGQNYDCLKEKLESYGTYFHIQGSVWIIRSQSTAAQVRDNIRTCLDSNDKLFVGELTGTAAWWGYSPANSKWLKDWL